MNKEQERDIARELHSYANDIEQERGRVNALSDLLRNAASLIAGLRFQRTCAQRDADSARTAAAVAGETLREQERTINRLRQERDAYRAETERHAANARDYRERASKCAARCTELCRALVGWLK